MTPDLDAADDAAAHLRDMERVELNAADDGYRRPTGYTGPVWAERGIPTRAECDMDEASW